MIAEASGAAARVALGQEPRQSARITYPHLTQTFKIKIMHTCFSFDRQFMRRLVPSLDHLVLLLKKRHNIYGRVDKHADFLVLMIRVYMAWF